MSGRNVALTTRQIARAAELYQDGHSRREIGAYFGRSEQAARTALALAGVAMRERKAAASDGVKRWAKSRKRVASVFDLGGAGLSGGLRQVARSHVRNSDFKNSSFTLNPQGSITETT